MHRLVPVLFVLLGGCRCGPVIEQVGPPVARIEPETLSFEPTYVGATRELPLTVTNAGGATSSWTLSLDAPFVFDATEPLLLSRGESRALTIRFAPVTAGHFERQLVVGETVALISGDALETPACVASAVCTDSHFDLNSARCVEATSADGTACSTRCISGTCQQATCVGQITGCDDSNACTLDGCSEANGCTHVTRTCPLPANPCEVPKCDSATGCGSEPANDGVLCGVDDCLSANVQVCISGQCVSRVRPDVGRCVNRWKPLDVPARYGASLAWDLVRSETLLFGGFGGGGNAFRGDTWSWNGTRWEQRFPAASPSPRTGHVMLTDPARRRIVLFGGRDLSGATNETWEWDGSNWLLRQFAVTPPPRLWHSMARDERRNRIVIFGGSDSNSVIHGDTWEYDGFSWRQITTPHAPPARSQASMAWDARKGVLVMHGGDQPGTWEYDGSDWTQVSSTGPDRRYAMLTWDEASQRVISFGGFSPMSMWTDDSWAWDGTTWTELSPATRPPPRATSFGSWDPVRRRIVIFGGYDSGARFDTWEWDGSNWLELAIRSGPPRGLPSLAADSTRGTIVSYGGLETIVSGGIGTDVHWAWDGATWHQLAIATPPARLDAAFSRDATNDRLVLFGGNSIDAGATLVRDETWTFDGTSWALAQPANRPPPLSAPAMAWDANRQRLVLFGGWTGSAYSNQTWEWDGTTWTQRLPLVSPPVRIGHRLVFDDVSQRVLLFGGTNGVQRFGDLWAWDGTDWSQLSPSTSPTPRTSAQLIFDPVRHTAVLFGGYTGATNAETWEYANGSWVQRMPVESPLPQYVVLVFDPVRGKVMALDNGTWWAWLP